MLIFFAQVLHKHKPAKAGFFIAETKNMNPVWVVEDRIDAMWAEVDRAGDKNYQRLKHLCEKGFATEQNVEAEMNRYSNVVDQIKLKHGLERLIRWSNWPYVNSASRVSFSN